MNQPTIYFKCDPDKNTACKKTACYRHGGPCYCTVNPASAKVPVETVKLIIPMSKEDAKAILGTDDEQQ